MKITLKIRYVLLALYEHKYNGKLYELANIFASNGLKINPIEIQEIARTLQKDGLIRTMSIGDTLYAQITMDGVEFLEDNNFFSGSSYLPQDRINPLEREVLVHKLEELNRQFYTSEAGKLVPVAMLEREMEELKTLLNILGKRSWLHILKGKVYELCAGRASTEEINALLRIFEADPITQDMHLPDFTI